MDAPSIILWYNSRCINDRVDSAYYTVQNNIIILVHFKSVKNLTKQNVVKLIYLVQQCFSFGSVWTKISHNNSAI